MSGVRGAKGCFSFTAANIWPYKFILHLLSLVVARGVNLQTSTLVTSVSSKIDPTDGKWLVTTPRGSVKAAKIVFASNGYTAGIAPEYARKIVPCRGICARITGPDGSPLPYLQNSYVIRNGPRTYDYLLSRPDGSVVIGGARSTFFDDKKTWHDITNDDELIEPARNYFDGFMQKSFRGWENTGAVTERVWTGSMSPPTSPLLYFFSMRSFRLFLFLPWISSSLWGMGDGGREREGPVSMPLPVMRYDLIRCHCFLRLQRRLERV